MAGHTEGRFVDVKAFTQHGFIPKDESETETWGTCPFCGRDGKMYVSRQTHAWDCKTCTKRGGFQTFLSAISDQCRKDFMGEKARTLSDGRGIPIKTFEQFHLGYNLLTKSYTFPVYDIEDRKKIVDLRQFSNGRVISTSSCKTGLWNANEIKERRGRVWLCEGEWDGMALWGVLQAAGRAEDAVVAVPGAGVFKPHWVPLFRNREVVALYDADEPGRKGSVRCYNMIKPVAASIHFLHWPQGLADGYDVRDLVKETPDRHKVLEYIEGHLQDRPTGEVIEEIKKANAVVIYDGVGVPADTVRDRYANWLHVVDPDIIDVLYGAVLANRLPGDPIWLMLVAPPGMTKTEYLSSFTNAKGIDTISSLTPATLISGHISSGGADSSLIPQWNEKVVVIKDFTAILNLNQQARDEIFGILRDAYDGECRKPFGNGKIASYESRFGILAGVTPAIDTVLENQAELGERFLRWETRAPANVADHLVFLRKAAQNVTHEGTMRLDLRTISSECLDYDFPKEVEIPDKIEDTVLHMAILVSMLRGTVPRDKYTKEIVAHPFIEMATRLSKTMLKELRGICMFRRLSKATENELSIIRKLANMTAPRRTACIIESAYRTFGDSSFTVPEMAKAIGLPQPITQRHIESLAMLGMIACPTAAGSLRASYTISPDVFKIIKGTRFFRE